MGGRADKGTSICSIAILVPMTQCAFHFFNSVGHLAYFGTWLTLSVAK
jgi:hypothetical protein